MFNFLKIKKKRDFKPDWLIFGLGNPGSKYKNNRHNIGWMVAQALCEKYKAPLVQTSLIYNTADILIAEIAVKVVQPTTYMNRSGEAVRKLMNLHNVPSDRIIVVVDEYNFPLGKIHIKNTGKDGGHNGVLNIIEETGTNNFFKLRCGIGKNFGAGGLVDYVLSDFEPDEIESKVQMTDNAVKAIIHFLSLNNPDRAMSEINSGKIFDN